MVEEDPVDGEHVVGLAVVHRRPVGGRPWRRRTGCADGTASPRSAAAARRRTSRRRTPGRSAGFTPASRIASRSRDRAGAGDVEGVLRDVERDPDVALRAQVVDLVGLEFVEELDQRHRVGEVAVVREQPNPLLVGVVVEVIDPVGVEARGAADDAVDLVPLLQQQLGQIGAILTRDPGDQGALLGPWDPGKTGVRFVRLAARSWPRAAGMVAEDGGQPAEGPMVNLAPTMRVLITGGAGFVGANLGISLAAAPSRLGARRLRQPLPARLRAQPAAAGPSRDRLREGRRPGPRGALGDRGSTR